MQTFGLSPQQLEVISALSTGATVIAAAAQAGVHPNSIGNWRCSSLPFREALARAQYDKALLFRERAETLVDLAYQRLEELLNDPKTPASVRFKAIQYIIDKASTPPPPKPETVPNLDLVPAPSATPAKSPETCTNLHKFAQATAPNLHNFAQSPPAAPAFTPPATLRRDQPKVGRNDVCPCGSGNKFKRCCLGKPLAQAA